MAIYQKVDQRIISGVGGIQLPFGAENLDLRHIVWIAEVIRPPSNRYRNFDWRPARELFARIVFSKNGNVVKEDTMMYPFVRWDDVPDPASQALIATQCSYKGVLESFRNLGIALGLTITQYENTISEYSTLAPTWDTMIVKCYSNTALRLTVYKLINERCGDYGGQAQGDVQSDPRPSVVSSDTPVEVSPPYPEPPNGSAPLPYEPFPGDAPPPPPPPVCGSFSGTLSVPFLYLGGRINQFPISGNTPARILWTSTPKLGGRVLLQSSACNGGQVSGLYTIEQNITSVGGGSPEQWFGQPSYSGSGTVEIVGD